MKKIIKIMIMIILIIINIIVPVGLGYTVLAEEITGNTETENKEENKEEKNIKKGRWIFFIITGAVIISIIIFKIINKPDSSDFDNIIKQKMQELEIKMKEYRKAKEALEKEENNE